MPSTSAAQQRFFGLVRAVQKGKVPSSKLKRVGKDVKRAARTMSASDVKDFTKRASEALARVSLRIRLLKTAEDTGQTLPPAPLAAATTSTPPNASLGVVDALRRRPSLMALYMAAKITLGGAFLGSAALLGLKLRKEKSPWQKAREIAGLS